VTGELDKTIQAYEIWRQLYPSDLVPANNLADLFIQAGEPDKAIEPARDAVRISPKNGFPYAALVQAYMRSGQFAEAKTVYQAAVSQKVDGILIHSLRFAIAFEDKD
jgi:eukaryotic-like serine/threonine-protein kinase